MITCLNVVAGTIAIIFAAQGNEPIAGLWAYQWAYIFIGIAALADFLDGFSARLLKAYSEVGKKLDSLCDLVSFGVAPAILLYQAVMDCGGAEYVAWAALLLPATAAFRLARFNVDDRQTNSFIGLPVPANALFWIGFTSLYYEMGGILNWLTIVMVVLFSWLMLSPIHIYSLKFRNLNFKENSQRYFLILATLIFVIFLGIEGIAVAVLYYVISSVMQNYKSK